MKIEQVVEFIFCMKISSFKQLNSKNIGKNKNTSHTYKNTFIHTIKKKLLSNIYNKGNRLNGG